MTLNSRNELPAEVLLMDKDIRQEFLSLFM